VTINWFLFLQIIINRYCFYNVYCSELEATRALNSLMKSSNEKN